MRSCEDIQYARAGDHPLILDLHVPSGGAAPYPLIVWIHGGAWRAGSRKQSCPAETVTEWGYALASISYRLSSVATFPAQIQDCKAAIRWLRANAGTQGLAVERIGAWGPSAGGHLVALLGTSGGVAGLEGELGNEAFSSRVQAVCDWFGPTDLLQMSAFPSSMDHDAADSPESQMVGGPIQGHPDATSRTNPIRYITGQRATLPDYARHRGPIGALQPE